MYANKSNDTINAKLVFTFMSYFHSFISYEIIFWGSPTHKDKIFLAQKRVIRIMRQINSTSCTEILKKVGIIILSGQFAYSLIVFVINNYDNFIHLGYVFI